MFLLLVMSLLLGNAALAADGETVKCWSITANSGFMGGFVSTFDKTEMRMTLDKLGLSVVSRAPKWDGIVFSEQNKKILFVPL